MSRILHRLIVTLSVLAGTLIAGPAGADVGPWQAGEPELNAPRATTPIIGVQYHAVWADRPSAVRARILDNLAAAGVKYVRMDVAWASLQPTTPRRFDTRYATQVDQRLREISDRGMKTLLLLHWPPKWSTGTDEKNGVPRDPAQFGRISSWVADRWQSDLVGIELFNEPDSPSFFATPDPKAYAELIKTAYPRIKAVAPQLVVVAGAPTYVKTSWYRSFFENGGADSYDALGIHPYIGLADQPPTACDTGNIEYYPCNIPNLISLMAEFGDPDRAIWATEYGWSSHDNTAYGPNVPNWKRGVTEDQQAQYMLQMQEVLSSWPQVQASFWYAAWSKKTGDPHEDNWGLLRRDFTRKPAFYAMRCIASGVCGPATTRPAVTPSAPVVTPNPQPTKVEVAVGKVRQLRAKPTRKNRVVVLWKAPVRAEGLRGYQVRWKARQGSRWQERQQRKTRIVLPAKKLRVQVRAVGPAGLGQAATIRVR